MRRPGARCIALAITAAMAFAACSDEAAGPVVVRDADSGTEVLLDTGDRLEIELAANATTGYTWEIAVPQPAMVDLVSRVYEPFDTDLVGSGGIETFVFAATGAGAGIIRLEYIRPFEDPAVPERIVEYLVRVDGAPWEAPDDPPPPTVTASADAVNIRVQSLLEDTTARRALVDGSIVWDAASARLCDALAESMPPQCGEAWVVIANPEMLGDTLPPDTLREAQGVRWTDQPVALDVWFDGQRIVIGGEPALAAPLPADRALAAAFQQFAGDPDPTTAQAVAWADTVALGLGAEIIVTVSGPDIARPANWTLERQEFQGYAGPFELLTPVADEVSLTLGSHPRCVAAPTAPPPGFEDHRRLSLQPQGATSCLEWFAVDLFVDAEQRIAAVTLDLHGP